MNKDDGTRIVVTRIRVDPDDLTKCGILTGMRCPGLFFSESVLRRYGCLLFNDSNLGSLPGDPYRCSSCLAAEVKVDEEIASTAKAISDDNEDWAPEFVDLARAYLALMEQLK